MKQIRVLDNLGHEHLYPVTQPVVEVTIGRSQNNDIVLSSKTVSRRHASLKFMGDRILLVNQSPNGVLVNGERVDRVRELRLGEFAAIEPYRFCVEVASAGARPQTGVQANLVAGRPMSNADELRRTIAPGDAYGRAPSVGQPAAPSSSNVAVAHAPQMRKPVVVTTPERFLGDLEPNDGYVEPRINLSGEVVQIHDRSKRQALVNFKVVLHEELKDRLDLHSFQITDYSSPRVVRQVSEKLKELLHQRGYDIPPPFTKEEVFKELMDEVCGLGPIEDLVKHRKVTEIMVVDREHIYAELGGKIILTDRFFNDEKAMMTVIERIVIPRGRRIDESNPLVDTRLADGSRVNAVIPPLALKDPCLTIRKFPEDRLSAYDLVKFGSMMPDMAKFLARSVRARKNIIISGGTGSGKTTLLNVLSSFIGQTERVVTIEDAAELQIHQEHVISLETKPPNLEGSGEVSIRDLVKNALRMRPDRIVVGECRGGEALDMLQAMNTGHDGSMTTVHSNSPVEAISRLETLVLMSGMELPSRAIREQIANSVDLIVQQSRFSDGSRRITYITEVVGIDDDGFIQLEDIYRYKQIGVDEKGKVQGYHLATGYLPSFLNEFLIKGLATSTDFF